MHAIICIWNISMILRINSMGYNNNHYYSNENMLQFDTNWRWFVVPKIICCSWMIPCNIVIWFIKDGICGVMLVYNSFRNIVFWNIYNWQTPNLSGKIKTNKSVVNTTSWKITLINGVQWKPHYGTDKILGLIYHVSLGTNCQSYSNTE